LKEARLPKDFDGLVSEADRHRDAGQYARAAEYYEQAAQLKPERADIWVQLGNMRKDSRQFALAEAAYRTALASSDQADTHLQLGHLFKSLGNRSAALSEYRRACELDESNMAAAHELAEAGQVREQERRASAGLLGGAYRALSDLSGTISALQSELDRVRRLVPDIAGHSAFPVSMYGVFRDQFPIPAPPETSPASFHVVIYAGDEPLSTLLRQVERVSSQSHPSWKLSVTGRDPERRRAVELLAVAEPRIGWIETRLAPAAAEIAAALDAKEEWLLLLAPGAMLDTHALAWFGCAASWSRADAFICDEEAARLADDGIERLAPVLRQVPDLDALLEQNIIGETLAIKSSAYNALRRHLQGISASADRSALLLHLAANQRIGHLPYPLVWHFESQTPACLKDHQEGVKHFLEQTGLLRRVEQAAAGRPLWRPGNAEAAICVIIPTRDNASDLALMIESLIATAMKPSRLEIQILDNGSQDEKTLEILNDIGKREQIRIHRRDEPFNWAHLNNRAAADTSAPLLLFANDDMEMRSTGWDVRIRGLLERDKIGAVGARLLYEDGTVQHAGILFGWRDSTIHDGLYADGEDRGPNGRWDLTRAVSAVTGAFLATRRADFIRLGGFDAVGLPVAYNDVDYALKLRAEGKRILWTPAITLLHRESKTRGLDHLDDWRAVRSAYERDTIMLRWGDALRYDPGVHPFWCPAALPFQLLSPPSSQRIREHIEMTGSATPWRANKRG
jgi:O-antigen biosynthesis protein